jgi:predicted amidophosphoribosyltransferase
MTPAAPTRAPKARRKAPAAPPKTIASTTVEMRVRERHFPRLCRACQAPMAVQEDNCWRCGALWDPSHTAEVANHVSERAVAA